MKIFITIFLILNYIIFIVNSSVNVQPQQTHDIKFKNLKSSTTKKLGESNNMDIINGHLKHILVERIADTVSHGKVKDYIISQFSNNPSLWKIELDSFKDITPHGEKTFTNIIVSSKYNSNNEEDEEEGGIGGDNEKDIKNEDIESSKTIVIAAHYDSKQFDDFKFMGATDSAVPCAMLIDFAHSLEKEIKQSKKRIMFIFFDGEEAFKEWTDTDSLYGSRHLAKLLLDKKIVTSNNNDETTTTSFYNSVEAFVLLDLLGAPNPRFYMFNKKTEPLFKKLSDIEDRLLSKRFISTKPYKYFQNRYLSSDIQDDHIPFLNYVPTLHIIPYPFPTVWHTVKDDESCLDKNVIEDISKIFKIFIASYLN